MTSLYGRKKSRTKGRESRPSIRRRKLRVEEVDPTTEGAIGISYSPAAEEARVVRDPQATRSWADLALFPGEDAAAFHSLHDELKRTHRPETPFQSEVVARAATLIWRLGRIPAFEASVFNATASSLGHNEEWLNLKPEIQSANFGQVLNVMFKTDALVKIAQYEAMLRDQLKLVHRELAEISDWHFKFDFA